MRLIHMMVIHVAAVEKKMKSYLISTMEVRHLVHHLRTLALLMLFFITSTTPFSDFETDGHQPLRICKYERMDEVKKECKSFLSSASKLKLGKQGYGNAQSLTFQNGDWVQEAGALPLMPFDDSDMPKNFSGPGSLLKLVSFWLMDVNLTLQNENAMSICAYMSIGITRNSTLHNMPERWNPWFYARTGTSDLRIPFEGLYMESEENGGERLLCLLGTSLSPFSEGFTYPFEVQMGYRCNRNDQPPFTKDDRILLVLRYPPNFTLTSKAILGELRSLHEKSDPRYFDKVHISSLFSFNSNYQFVSEKLVAKACDPYPYHDESIDDDIELFKGSQFCKIFKMFGAEIFDIVADLKCDDTKEYCNNLGPFVLGNEAKAMNGMLDNFRLMMTDMRCVPGDDLNKLRTAKVAAVFRAVSPLEIQYTAGARTGLSGMTISAEGTWNSSSGQVCMIGCVGLVQAESDQCNSRICLYIPLTFSLTQRCIVFGTISSIKTPHSYEPLFFKKVLRPLDLWNRYNDYSNSYLSYQYSKMELVSAILKKNENFKSGTFLKKSFLKYPTVEDTNNLTSLSLLSDKLSFGVYALPHPLHNFHSSKIYVQIEVFSLGPLFGRHWPDLRDSCQKEESKSPVNIDHSPRQNVLCNISAHLTLTGESYSHISVLFLEGLYDPHGGKMYLIGCREVPGFQKSNNKNLESRMDCLIEVKVEYSSKTIRWLINPTAKVSIASQRDEEDPLYFSPVSFQTFLITYVDNSKEYEFRRNFEEIFRALVLIASIACIFSQFFYVRKKKDAIPYVSLVMLGVQALGYGLPLITGSTILFKLKAFQYDYNRSYSIGKNIWVQGLHFTIKFLLLCAFVLSLRLCQKVWKSRTRLLMNNPTQSKRKASDIRVFLSTLMIHMVGFLVVHVVHNTKTEEIMHIKASLKVSPWLIELDEYMGLAQDFFLLPQVVGNFIWHIQVKPLRKVYYIGFTVLRLLLRIYDYIRDPVFVPVLHNAKFNPSSQFFSKSEDIVIMLTLALLAIIVHAQQKEYYKLLPALKSKQNKLPPFGTNLHKHLLTK